MSLYFTFLTLFTWGELWKCFILACLSPVQPFHIAAPELGQGQWATFLKSDTLALWAGHSAGEAVFSSVCFSWHQISVPGMWLEPGWSGPHYSWSAMLVIDPGLMNGGWVEREDSTLLTCSCLGQNPCDINWGLRNFSSSCLRWSYHRPQQENERRGSPVPTATHIPHPGLGVQKDAVNFGFTGTNSCSFSDLEGFLKYSDVSVSEPNNYVKLKGTVWWSLARWAKYFQRVTSLNGAWSMNEHLYYLSTLPCFCSIISYCQRLWKLTDKLLWLNIN